MRSRCWPITRTPPIIAGCTDWGVEVNLRGARASFVVAVDRLPELRTFAVDGEHIEIGAALTLSEIERLLDGRVPLLDALWPQFASRLIRNGATIGGNLGTGSPIGDVPPALLALRASVVLVGPDGEREVPLDEYFTGYRRTVRQEPDELIKAVRVPLPLAPLTAFHKIAKRRFDDISSVAVAFALDVARRHGRRRGHRARRRRGHAGARLGDRGRAVGRSWDAEHRPGGRGRAGATRARRSTTTGPAPPTGRRCSSSRCSSSAESGGEVQA